MLIDFAIKKLIPPGANDPKIKARMGILHVDANNSWSLEDYFRYRSGGIESHGHIRNDGRLEQYRDTDYEADANYYANPFALSFESQGYANGSWNAEQLETIKRTILWAKEYHGIDLRVPKTWNDEKGGWGYHTMFEEWHPEPKSCPGPRRKEQFHDIIVPWMKESRDMFGPDDSKRLENIEAEVAGLRQAFLRFRVNELNRDRALRDKVAKQFQLTSADLDKIITELTKG